MRLGRWELTVTLRKAPRRPVAAMKGRARSEGRKRIATTGRNAL